MNTPRSRIGVLFAFSACFLCFCFGQNFAQSKEFFQTPIDDSMLSGDRLLIETFDGLTKSIDEPRGVRKVLWTTKNDAEFIGVEFGKPNEPGTRYAVVSWDKPVTVGSLFVVSTAQPRLLKSTVDFASLDSAQIANDENWIVGQRLGANAQTTDAVEGVPRDAYLVWTFPAGTVSRAIRFAHTPDPTDKSYAGWIGAIYVSPHRLVNAAPFAAVRTDSQNQNSARLIDGTNNNVWQTWDNGKDGAEEKVSPDRPEQITLVWDAPVSIRGLAALWTGFSAAEAQVYVGNPAVHPNDSINPADWKTVASRSDLKNGYWRALYPNFLDFGQTYQTRAVRLNITQTTQESHPHLNGNTKDGRRVWLGELMALAPLADDANPASVVPARPEAAHAPIPIRFTLERPGEVSLVIETPEGKRIRNLISQTPFPAGENVVWWDGCDDLLRDEDKAKHGVYWIPRRPAAPGRYTVRGIVHDPITPRYEFSLYTEGNPPWRTADNTGWWLTNHTPPTCVAFWPGLRDADESSASDDLNKSVKSNDLTNADKTNNQDEPLLYIGSYVSEGGHGLAWFAVDETSANLTKRGGVNWVGGVWTGAKYLTRDAGPEAIPEHRLYAASGWEMDRDSAQGECRLTAITGEKDKPIGKYPYRTNRFQPGNAADDGTNSDSETKPKPDHERAVAGIAAWNGQVLIGLARSEKQILCVDAASGKILWDVSVPEDQDDRNRQDNQDAPFLRGLAFNDAGNLYVLLGTNLYRFETRDAARKTWAKPIYRGLDDPQGIAFDRELNVYISLAGTSNQILVLSPNGQPKGTIGKRGVLQIGPYDERQMQTPAGLAFDAQGRLWVAEANHQPKRVSVWTREGQFVRAYYGPAQYGGGGALDSGDPTRYLYGGMEFQIDWKTGKDRLVRILARKERSQYARPSGHYSGELPESAVYAYGKRYLTNCFNQNPTGGAPIAAIYAPVEATGDGEIRPLAACGNPNNWPIFQRDEFKSRLPEGVDLRKNRWSRCRFLWSDQNGDGQVQPAEVEFEPGACGGVTVQVLDGALTFLCARVESKDAAGADQAQAVAYPAENKSGKAEKQPEQNARLSFSFARKRVLADAVLPPASSGGDQVLYDPDRKEAFVTLGTGGYPQSSLCGTTDGAARWSYPSVWPGLHASHESPAPTFQGQLIGTTRLLGAPVRLPNYPSRLVAVNGNMGNVYLFTMDGLFIAELFHDERLASTWTMPIARRNVDLSRLTLGGENFWPTISQYADGKTYLIDGARTAIVRLDGLESARPITPTAITVTAADLAACADWIQAEELRRQARAGKTTVVVPILDSVFQNPDIQGRAGDAGASGQPIDRTSKKASVITTDDNTTDDNTTDLPIPTVDGNLTDWTNADWAVIDRSGVAAWFDSNSKPYDVTAAARVAGGKLYLAYRTGQKNLLINSGETPNALFKCGGCLDLMVGSADKQANPARRAPVAGDLRLLITVVENQPRAVLYRPVVPGTNPTDAVPFSSPWRTLKMDRVDDVSDQIQFADDKQGAFEIAVPLALLGLNPQPGLTIRADFGILRGDNGQTVSRTYWGNKATGIASDVPSEAELTPNLWGEWRFE